MGTRCLTVMIDDSGDEPKEMGVMYRQFDGYPDGHGIDLHNFLLGFKLYNGYPSNVTGKAANGASCLWAQVISYFKETLAEDKHKGNIERITSMPIMNQDIGEYLEQVKKQNYTIGNFYLEAPGTRDMNEEYVYFIYYNSPTIDSLMIKQSEVKPYPVSLVCNNVYDSKTEMDITYGVNENGELYEQNV